MDKSYALAWLDVSLSELYFEKHEKLEEILDLLNLVSPKEILIHDKILKKQEEPSFKLPPSLLLKEAISIKNQDEDYYKHLLSSHFYQKNLSSFGVDEKASLFACASLIDVLKTQRLYDLKNIEKIVSFRSKTYLKIDKSTQSHLELFDKKGNSKDKLTLLYHLDKCQTTGGSRLFESFLKFPLIDTMGILERQSGTTFFRLWEKTPLLRNQLGHLKDIQKILAKIENKIASPVDLKNLQKTLEGIAAIKELFNQDLPLIVQKACEALDPNQGLISLLSQSLIEQPALRLHEGKTFLKGYKKELDELLDLTESQEEFLNQYELKLKEETGIKTLKVGASKSFGFYIEISRMQAQNAPAHFIRRQTLTNQERFITEELSIFERKSFTAKEQLILLEKQFFDELLQEVLKEKVTLIKTFDAICLLDVLASFGVHAQKNGYTLPTLANENTLILKQAFHPIIQELIGSHAFIPNDLVLNKKPDTLMLLTGPNMAGKSTYMRQAALCVIMAQLGMYVPCEMMHFSPVDRLFTRIGASDDISSGQSTFMVEMAETAYILNHSTEHSLVILDEIGRGTSTYDGIAIAYAIANYLMHHPKGAPKTLFATHYFELTEMENEDPRIVNYNVGVKEEKGELLFLHKIFKGAADKSYGIQVAKLAGLPKEVIDCAKTKLRQLLDPSFDLFKPQMSFTFEEQKQEPLKEELAKLDLDDLTPKEALNTLFLWKKQFLT
jgi:DNA mismatch repair protein MutS